MKPTTLKVAVAQNLFLHTVGNAHFTTPETQLLIEETDTGDSLQTLQHNRGHESTRTIVVHTDSVKDHRPRPNAENSTWPECNTYVTAVWTIMIGRLLSHSKIAMADLLTESG